jgi:EF hand
MRKGILLLAVALCCTPTVHAQRPGGPGGRDGPPRFGGPGGPPRFGDGALDRAIADLNFTGTKREKALEAARAYGEDVRRLGDLASADLVLKLKGILDENEYATLTRATARARGETVTPQRRRGAEDAAVVERLLSFDKDGDGFVTKEELPERMQYLIAKGDTNKDGKLDRDEIRKMSSEVARTDTRGRGRGAEVVSGRLTPRAVERALADLKLSESKKEAAAAAVQASKDNLRKLTELGRADVLLRVNGVLSTEEANKLVAAVESLPIEGGPRGP